MGGNRDAGVKGSIRISERAPSETNLDLERDVSLREVDLTDDAVLLEGERTSAELLRKRISINLRFYPS